MNVIKKCIGMLLFMLGSQLAADGQDHQMTADSSHHMMNNASLKWMDAPAGLPKGAKVAVLQGDPGKAGPFTIRIMFPANYEIKPHWHPTAENVTVLQGSLYMGSGEMFNKDKATMLSSGGFTSMPARFAHYAFTRDGATIQLHGQGPFEITYYKITDDPRKAQ